MKEDINEKMQILKHRGTEKRKKLKEQYKVKQNLILEKNQEIKNEKDEN